MVEYESFEDALKSLGVNEDELKRMVSEGQLRAYRDEDKMKFRRDDVENLKRSNLSDIGSAPSMTPTEVGHGLEVVEQTDDTILDLGELSDDIDFEDTGDTSVPTVDISGGSGGDTGGLTGELVFDEGDINLNDADATIAMDDGLSLDDDMGLETEPLGGFDESDATVVEGGVDLALDGDFDLEGGNQQMMGGYMAAPMYAPQIQVQEKVRYVEILPTEGWVTKAIAAVLLIVMFFGLAAFWAVQSGTDTMGVASFGFSINHPGSTNAAVGAATMVPMAGDAPMPTTNADFSNPKHWILSSGTDDLSVYPGMSVIRIKDADDKRSGQYEERPARFTVADAKDLVKNNPTSVPSKYTAHRDAFGKAEGAAR